MEEGREVAVAVAYMGAGLFFIVVCLGLLLEIPIGWIVVILAVSAVIALFIYALLTDEGYSTL